MQGTNAFALGLLERMEGDVARLQRAAEAGEQAGAQALAQGLVGDVKDLESAAGETAKPVKATKRERWGFFSSFLSFFSFPVQTAALALIKKVPEALQDRAALPDLDRAAAQARRKKEKEKREHAL